MGEKNKKISIPVLLKHKPVLVVENYENIDGKKAYNSDAKGLSLGLAQWNDRGKLDISAKIWRYTGEKWSRQSEELPLHRVVDLMLLLCSAKQYFNEAYRYKKLYNPEYTNVNTIGVQGDAMRISVCTENGMIDEDIKIFDQILREEDEFLSERLHILANLLNDMGYGNNHK